MRSRPFASASLPPCLCKAAAKRRKPLQLPLQLWQRQPPRLVKPWLPPWPWPAPWRWLRLPRWPRWREVREVTLVAFEEASWPSSLWASEYFASPLICNSHCKGSQSQIAKGWFIGVRVKCLKPFDRTTDWLLQTLSWPIGNLNLCDGVHGKIPLARSAQRSLWIAVACWKRTTMLVRSARNRRSISPVSESKKKVQNISHAACAGEWLEWNLLKWYGVVCFSGWPSQAWNCLICLRDVSFSQHPCILYILGYSIILRVLWCFVTTCIGWACARSLETQHCEADVCSKSAWSQPQTCGAGESSACRRGLHGLDHLTLDLGCLLRSWDLRVSCYNWEHQGLSQWDIDLVNRTVYPMFIELYGYHQDDTEIKSMYLGIWTHMPSQQVQWYAFYNIYSMYIYIYTCRWL